MNASRRRLPFLDLKRLGVWKRGQGLVEFALVIPIVLLLMFGIIEGGRLLFFYTSLSAAGREAARYGAGIGNVPAISIPLYDDCSGIRAAAKRIGFLTGIQDSDIIIYHDTGPNDPTPKAYCLGSTDTETFGRGDRILISITKNYKTLVPIVPIPDLTLHSQSAHTILKGASIVAITPTPIHIGQTCDNTKYIITAPSNMLGPVINFTITNTGTDLLTIKDVLVVWDTTGGPILNTITATLPGPTPYTKTLNSIGPYVDTSVSWDFSPAPSTPISFSLNFSKALKNNVIIRITPSNNCAFGM